MKSRVYRIVFWGLLLSLAVSVMAQIPPDEAADRAKWEEFLRTAKIVDHKEITGIGAVTHPKRLTLEKDGVRRSALWKKVSGRPQGYIDNWMYEIAAYEMDKLLGLNMVPPTVEIRHDGDRGSCQLWEGVRMTLLEKEEKKINIPSFKAFGWNRAVFLQRAFDNLIANEDRHRANILIAGDWRVILIDHSRSFRTSKKFIEGLIYTEKHREGPKLMKELPRAFVEKLKTLSFESIKAAVGEYLTDEEIRAVLTRRELILKEVDRLIKLHGEENVLY